MHVRFTFATLLSSAIVTGAFLTGFIPAAVAADTAINTPPSVNAEQILSGNAPCAVPSVSVTPYIYSGVMDSFDVNVSDPTYVSLAGKVGNFNIPLQLMTRRMNSNGSVRIHIDIPSTPIAGSVPVSITMLSAQQGICAATVSFAVQGPAPILAPPATIPVMPEQTSEPTSSPTSAPQGFATTTLPAVTSSIVAGPFSSISGSISRICEVNQGSYELWLTLLAAYFVFVVATVFSNMPALRESNTLSTTAILVPFLALFLLWYAMPECRAASWTGVIAALIAIGGLVALYRGEVAENMKLLPQPAAVPLIPTAPVSAAAAPAKADPAQKK